VTPATLAMQTHDWYYAVGELVKVLWVMAFGACIGSLINVLVYRIPLGLDYVRPTSQCPSCETHLTWRENVPIFGWLFLGGRCRFCRSRISAEYPTVEAFVAILFAMVYLTLYAEDALWHGKVFAAIRPEWAAGGFVETWPAFVIVLVLFSCLVTMMLIDAKTCLIPMELTWVPLAVALVGHPLHALWIERTRQHLTSTATGEVWTMATPGHFGWWWIGGALGGAAGLIISNVLLLTGLIKRSFADYPEWEKAEQERMQAETPPETGDRFDLMPVRPESPTDLWIRYPHARREMVREFIFLAPCIGLGLTGAALAFRFAGPRAANFGDAILFDHAAPLWLVALAGVLLGYLIGGGAVWAMRIFGSLGAGKEGMGVGDVHMMAAVGACLGWIDPVLAFFGAAFLGVGWAVAGRILSGGFKRAMPFGPFLAVATILGWFGKPMLERLLSVIFKSPIDLP